MADKKSGPEHDLGFDPDSPDLEDPQVDPVKPAEAPENGRDVGSDKRVDDDKYPPYKTAK
jgi:hypothetical protein